MSWTTYAEEVRRLLSDGPKDRLRHRQKVFGQVDGTNKVFKTLEFRRVTDFTTASAPEGVYVNGVAAAVTSDDLDSGEFELTDAPVDGDVVEATHYVQWFTDDELTQFISDAARWLSFGTAGDVPPGLQPSALHFALQEAYQKLSIRWSEMLSNTYRLEDMPADNIVKMAESFQKSADLMHKKSTDLRNDFYTRQGQNRSPNFGTILGHVPDVVPKR
jgi:hypothetical protein